MKSFKEIFKQGKKTLSLEFFPPKKEESLTGTEALMRELSYFSPDFMTVTYGAGGGTRGFSKRLVSYITNTLGLPSVAHLTCVGHSTQEINEIASSLKAEGIRHILALRGDPPQGETSFSMHPQGFNCARDLTNHLNKLGDFSIAVAGYPETHPDAGSPEEDLMYLKSKVDAGAEIIITQLFFDPELYFTFCENARSIGIETPIIPGIMPIQDVAQLERFTSMCGASIPANLYEELKLIKNEPEAVIEFGISYAISQIEKLLEGGAPGVHLYTLNKSKQIVPVIEAFRSRF